jgi:hypothetical protein
VLKKLLLSLVALESMGNSNWYIFTILVLYLMTFIAWQIGKKKPVLFLILQGVLTAGFVFVMLHFKETYWYNTAFAYVFGLFWAMYKEKLDKLFSHPIIYVLSLAGGAVLYHVTRTYSDNIVMYELMAVFFAFLVVLFTMRVKIGNACLCYLGKHLFPFYILQRLPMIVLKSKTDVLSNNTVFMLYSMLFTVLLVFGYIVLEHILKDRKEAT